MYLSVATVSTKFVGVWFYFTKSFNDFTWNGPYRSVINTVESDVRKHNSVFNAKCSSDLIWRYNVDIKIIIKAKERCIDE